MKSLSGHARGMGRPLSVLPLVMMMSARVLLAGCLFFMSCGAPSPEAPPGPTNVLFIAIDDLNDWVGFLQGHPQVRTPNMDRLARRGTVFTNAHCASPICCPSRAAIFSGRQPHNTGVYRNEHDLRKQAPDLELLPKTFSRHGYRTFGTGKLLHRDRRDLFDESFFPHQRWSPFTRKTVQYTAKELPSKGTNDPRHVIDPGPEGKRFVLPFNRMPSDRAPSRPSGESFDWAAIDVDEGLWGDTQSAEWAAKQLKKPRDEPFFLAAGFYRPHIPLYAPKEYFRFYPAGTTKLPPVLENDLDDLGPVARKWAVEAVTAGSHATVVKHGQWKEAVAAYLACITFVDAQIGKILDALDSGPHAEDTLVVLWSDHGWHLGEKRHWGKWTGWERSTRVPLAVVPARRDRAAFRTSTRCGRPVSLIDLYPTLLDLCGLPPIAGLDGLSMRRYLQDPEAASPRPVVTTFDEGNTSIRDDRWRLIHYADGSEELYDLKNDPNEWKNLIGDSSLEKAISSLRRWVPGS